MTVPPTTCLALACGVEGGEEEGLQALQNVQDERNTLAVAEDLDDGRRDRKALLGAVRKVHMVHLLYPYP